MCPNKEDLNFCANVSSWKAPVSNWKPMNHLPTDFQKAVKCSAKNQTNEMLPNGQWIKENEKEDGGLYHCLNRKDEQPFADKLRKSGSSNTWWGLMNTTCDDSYKRRCMGSRPDQCAWANGK